MLFNTALLALAATSLVAAHGKIAVAVSFSLPSIPAQIRINTFLPDW
jgi:hypothetical protein